MGGWLPFPADGSSEQFLGVLAHFHGEEAHEIWGYRASQAEGQLLSQAGICAEPGFVLMHGWGRWERWGKQWFEIDISGEYQRLAFSDFRTAEEEPRAPAIPPSLPRGLACSPPSHGAAAPSFGSQFLPSSGSEEQNHPGGVPVCWECANCSRELAPGFGRSSLHCPLGLT